MSGGNTTTRGSIVTVKFQVRDTPIQLAHNCGVHRRELDTRAPLHDQVWDVFQSAPIRLQYGMIKAAYAQINGLLVVYDGFSTGFVHKVLPRQEDWPSWQVGLIGQAGDLHMARKEDLRTNAIRRFYVTEEGTVQFTV